MGPFRPALVSFACGIALAVALALLTDAVGGRIGVRADGSEKRRESAVDSLYVVLDASGREAARAYEVDAADRARTAARHALASVVAARATEPQPAATNYAPDQHDARLAPTSTGGEATTVRESDETTTIAAAETPRAVVPEDRRADGSHHHDAVSRSNGAQPIDGMWMVTNAVESTHDRASAGLRFDYRLQLHQQNGRIEGRGARVAKNGKPLPRSHQTPVFVTGTTSAGRVDLRIVEHGRRNRSAGRFTWNVTPDGDQLAGRFATDANTTGRSEARRVSD